MKITLKIEPSAPRNSSKITKSYKKKLKSELLDISRETFVKYASLKSLYFITKIAINDVRKTILLKRKDQKYSIHPVSNHPEWAFHDFNNERLTLSFQASVMYETLKRPVDLSSICHQSGDMMSTSNSWKRNRHIYDDEDITRALYSLCAVIRFDLPKAYKILKVQPERHYPFPTVSVMQAILPESLYKIFGRGFRRGYYSGKNDALQVLQRIEDQILPKLLEYELKTRILKERTLAFESNSKKKEKPEDIILTTKTEITEKSSKKIPYKKWNNVDVDLTDDKDKVEKIEKPSDNRIVVKLTPEGNIPVDDWPTVFDIQQHILTYKNAAEKRKKEPSYSYNADDQSKHTLDYYIKFDYSDVKEESKKKTEEQITIMSNSKIDDNKDQRDEVYNLLDLVSGINGTSGTINIKKSKNVDQVARWFGKVPEDKEDYENEDDYIIVMTSITSVPSFDIPNNQITLSRIS